MDSHLRKHSTTYISFLVIAIFVSFLLYHRYEVKADTSPVFVKSILYSEGDGYDFHPFRIALDSGNNLYALDDWNGYVLKFNAEGNYVTRFGGFGGGPGEFDSPLGIAVSGGFVYVTDCGSSIKKYTTEGVYVSSFGSSGTGDGQFGCPFAIAADAEGNVYVSDNNNSVSQSRIQKFDTDGNFISKFGQRGTGDGQFRSVGSMLINSDSIYIVDLINFRIQKFDSSGNFVMKFGTQGTGNGQFSNISGVAVDSEGFIYVGDFNRGVIQKFSAAGEYLSSISSGESAFTNTSDLVANSSHALYASQYNDGYVAQFFLPPPPLVLSSISALSSSTSTVVSFTTDDLGSTQVEFGPTTTYGSSTPLSDLSPKVTSHTATLVGLAPCALYNYRVSSASDTSTTTSTNLTFITDACTGSASSIASSATTVSTTATSTVTLSTITISIPPTFSTTTEATTTFQAVKLEPAAFFASSSVPAGTQSATSDVFHLTALTDATTTLTTFTAPITVTLSYDPATLSTAINPATLTIYRYDEGSWHTLSNCTRDTSAHTVTCETSHFSDFALFGSPNTSSVTYGASGYQNAPDGHLTSSPPADVLTPSDVALATTSPVATTTIPKSEVTPVQVQPKPIVPKPAPVVTTVKITQPQSLPHPLTATTSPVLQRPTDTPPTPIVQKKTILQRLLEWWRRR